MNRLTSLLLATAMALPAAAAVAQTNHEVRIERLGYFPGTVYVQPGDTITFTNAKPWAVTINSIDPFDNLDKYNPRNPCRRSRFYNGDRDGFSIPAIAGGQSVTITVTECMESRIHEPNFGAYYNATRRHTLFEFGEAPNGS